MIGKIIGIEENCVYVKLDLELDKFQNLIQLYVTIEDKESNIIGEVVSIKDDIATINLVGELIDEEFTAGVIKKPSFGSKVKLVPKNKIQFIIGEKEYDEREHLIIGKNPIYDENVTIKINKFFSEHFAIFGSTGSGKSCSVSRIIQNLFSKNDPVPYKASFFIFDAYGEYHTAFEHLNRKVPEISFKVYTTNLKDKQHELLRIPIWLLSVDDICLLLGVEKHSQILLIEKALKLLTVFAKDEDEVIKSKNDIIARALLDILSSGRQSTQIRDQVISVLTNHYTKELNLDTRIIQPGYVRTLKQCLLIDSSGKMRDMEIVVEFIQKFLDDDYELKFPDGSFMYTIDDLKDAFDFALISEGALKSDKIYDESNVLKVRLYALATGEERVYFDYPEYVNREQYIRRLLTTENKHKAQIVNFNINYIDDRLAKNITKIYSKMLFDFAKELDNRASFPIHIVLEEAHRYVQNDNDKFLLGYNIFERITKEGRKYGVLLGLISQRPSEISETTVSQCSNFLIFKIIHPTDVEYIRKMVPNVNDEIMKKMQILQPGTCVAFGSAFKLPTIVRIPMPSPAPSSDSCNISQNWFVDRKK